MSVWIVRAGRGRLHAATPMEQVVVGIGWAELGDLCTVTAREQVGTAFPKKTARPMTSAPTFC